MGKYMRKAKITGEVAVMELTHHQLGVRTRAKTLALQRLQNTPMDGGAGGGGGGSACSSNSGSSYLQLRNRRLEKPPLLHDSRKQEQQQNHEEGCKEISPNPNPSQTPRNRLSRTSSRLAVASVNSGSVGSVKLCYSKNEDGFCVKEEQPAQENVNDVGFEASFGENVLEIEPRERTTRETTPCSLIRGSETIGTPGSTTRPTISSATNRRVPNTMRRNIPTAHEMEEFFAGAEQQQQRIFTEKYNFDPLTETPLPGRYEWERVDP